MINIKKCQRPFSFSWGGHASHIWTLRSYNGFYSSGHSFDNASAIRISLPSQYLMVTSYGWRHKSIDGSLPGGGGELLLDSSAEWPPWDCGQFLRWSFGPINKSGTRKPWSREAQRHPPPFCYAIVTQISFLIYSIPNCFKSSLVRAMESSQRYFFP